MKIITFSLRVCIYVLKNLIRKIDSQKKNNNNNNHKHQKKENYTNLYQSKDPNIYTKEITNEKKEKHTMIYIQTDQNTGKAKRSNVL